jgi:hypothetical protein
MAFLFITAGIFFLVAGVRGQSAAALKQLKGDLVGTDSYLVWLGAILLIGAVGYVDELRPISHAFLILVLIVLLLSNGGFFSQLETQFQGVASGQ